MTAKEYLNTAWLLKAEIESKQEQIIVLRTMARRATGLSEALRTSGTKNHSKLEDAVIELTEIGDMLGKDLEQFTQSYRKIQKAVDSVQDPICRKLLSMRYLEFKTWEAIAETLDYSYVHIVHRLHPKALREISVA